MLDFHNHLMPDVDDGAANIDESRDGLLAMQADGITQIITTPHISASLSGAPFERYLQRIERGWDQLQTLAVTEFPSLRLERGFEVMLDTPHPVLDNPLLRLAGTQFVLVEFPFMSIPPNSAYAVRELRDAGWIPVVAHPERYSNMESAMHLIEQWRDAGAYLQVNAGSFMGVYGARAKKLVWTILGDGHAEYMCSDYHSRGKCNVAAAHAVLREAGFDAQLETMISNGLSLLKGERPSPVGSMLEKPRAGWKKVFPWI